MSTKLKETTKVFSYILPVWSLWYLGVLLIIYIISHIFSNEAMSSFFGFTFTANRTYMLVIGIIVMIGFLEWAIGMGVSRKTFFKSVVHRDYNDGNDYSNCRNSVIHSVIHTIFRRLFIRRRSQVLK